MNRLAESIIRDIIVTQMPLPSDQVWIRNQPRQIPQDANKLFVVVGDIDSKVMSVTNHVVDVPSGGMEENQRVYRRVNVQIDIFSRDEQAIERQWEILAALESVYSKQQQELEQFKIFRIPSVFMNTTETEGPARINKYTIVIACFVSQIKTNLLIDPGAKEYFDDFKTRVDDYKTIDDLNGLIELSFVPE